jgi:hypothetical protein
VTRSRPAAAVILVAVSLALTGCATLGGAATPSPTPTGPPEVDVLSLDVGDCLATTGNHGTTSTVPVVECSQEHESEVYSRLVLDDDTFPGDDAVRDRAVTGCTQRFAEFVGIAYDDSSLDFAYYFPTRTSWERGDRDIVCLVIDPQAASIMGTLADAAR